MKNKLTRKILSLILATIILLSAFTIPSSAFSLKVCNNPYIIFSKWHLCILKDYTEPDCENNGYVIYKCVFCKYTKSTIKEAYGHSLYESETVNPTCENDGYITYSCENCYYTEKEAISKIGHEIIEIEKVDSTCLEDGYIKFVCKNCDYTEEETILNTGHKIIEIEKVDATCLEDGYTKFMCEDCEYSGMTINHKTGHNLIWVDGKDATCTEAGYEYVDCENCRCTIYKDIPAKGHDVVVIKSAVEPTCTEDGRTEEKRCRVCSTLIKRSKKIPALGHTYQNAEITKATTEEDGTIKGKCNVCGEYNQSIIKKPKYAVTKEKAYTYTGEEIKPTITVYDEDDNIIDEAEYYVEYSNNINEGWALVDVYFTGEKYEGHLDTVFLIDIPPEFKYYHIYNTSPNGFTVEFDISITVKKMEIQFSQNSDFEKAETVIRSVSTDNADTKKFKYSVAGLQKSTTYYVRMRLQYENGTYSDWVTKSIEILNH